MPNFKLLLIKLSLLFIITLGTGCISTAIGVTAKSAVAVTAAVITAPIKIGSAVVDAISDDDEED